jgi:hypothetical protein
MSETYAIRHKEQMDKGTKEDPVTMEDLRSIAEAGREIISYLRLNKNIPVIMVYYHTPSAYTTFITNNFPKEPETNLPLNPGFKARIDLYYTALSSLSPEQLLLSTRRETPERQAQDDQVKRDMFGRYLRGEGTPVERLILQISLFIDDANVVHSYTRAEANTLLETAQVGQWLLRKSSYPDTELITNRAISMKTSTKINHYLITHIKGYGYMVSPKFPTRQQLGLPVRPELNETPDDIVVATLGSQIPIPIGKEVYSCFISALESIFQTSDEFVRAQLIGLGA